jgi:hypothetical protein
MSRAVAIAGAVQIVRRFGFEQLGVGENDPQLVVQPVKQKPQRRGFVTGIGGVHDP